jgi:hypothetical protein
MALPLIYQLSGPAGRRRLGRGKLGHAVGPALVSLLGDVELPVDGQEEGHLILVDFQSVKARDLAPCAS